MRFKKDGISITAHMLSHDQNETCHQAWRLSDQNHKLNYRKSLLRGSKDLASKQPKQSAQPKGTRTKPPPPRPSRPNRGHFHHHLTLFGKKNSVRLEKTPGNPIQLGAATTTTTGGSTSPIAPGKVCSRVHPSLRSQTLLQFHVFLHQPCIERA